MRQRLWSCAAQLVDEQGFVSPVDLLVKMERITRKQLEDWRYKRIRYLEQATQGNLSKMKFILDELRKFGQSAKLKPSHTAYMSWGKGPKQRLRFSKSGDPGIETMYSTHYVLVKTKISNSEKEVETKDIHDF